jgi:hypothetical protein
MTQAPILHIIAQTYHHQPAFVIGNQEGLTALRDAIDAALKGNDPAEAGVRPSDGEGYRVHVRCVTDCDNIPLGYTDGEACPDETPWPDWMIEAR